MQAEAGEDLFITPKPVRLLRRILDVAGDDADADDIILDFFAGSCTTAQAVLELNREDGGNRRFIMVQLPEPTGREDFPTIADIGKERIRRVIQRMQEAPKDKAQGNLDLEKRDTPEDLGFKVYKLAESQFRNWPGVKADNTTDLPQDYARQMELYSDGLADGWQPEAVIAEVAMKEAGFGLNCRVEAIAGKDGLWRVTDPELGREFVISLADRLGMEDLDGLELTEETLFVCRATALDDTTAANLELQCRLRVI